MARPTTGTVDGTRPLTLVVPLAEDSPVASLVTAFAVRRLEKALVY